MSHSLTSDDLSPTTLRGYDLLREEAGLIDFLKIGILELRGDDKKAWLQGQMTNDLRPVIPGGSTSFCFIKPTGQLIANCDFWIEGDRYLVTAPLETMPAILERCEGMIIIEDVQYTDLTNDFDILSIQGPSASRALGELVTLPTLDAGRVEFEGAEIVCLRSNRTGFGGWDLLIPKGNEKAVQKLREAFEAVEEPAFDIARLEAGIPVYGRDMNEKTLPPEMGPNFETKYISYNKGCYTGQEVLMRIHSRGHTNKTWMALISEDPMPVGSEIGHMSREDAGIVTSFVDSPRYGYIAGAVLRKEAAFTGEIVRIKTEDGVVEAEVRAMPVLRFE